MGENIYTHQFLVFDYACMGWHLDGDDRLREVQFCSCVSSITLCDGVFGWHYLVCSDFVGLNMSIAKFEFDTMINEVVYTLRRI